MSPLENTPPMKHDRHPLLKPLYYLLGACAVIAFVVATHNDTAKKPSAVPNLVEKTGEHFTKGAIRAIKDEFTTPETLTTEN